jgi:two-component system, NarL family, response regulator, fimbrial Z protein, FimZ
MYKVMIVDDMPKHRQQIEGIIKQIAGLEIIACLENGIQVIEWLYNKIDVPDIIVLDIEMPKLDGLGVMDFLHDFFPTIKVLAISSHGEKHIVKDIIAAGAMGFLWKYDNYPYLKQAVIRIINNEVYMDERLSHDAHNRELLIRERTIEKEKIKQIHEFTEREWQIMKIIVSQTNYIEIGRVLNITQKTVETYVTRLNKKLGITGGRVSLHNFSFSRGIMLIAKLSKFKPQ